MALIPIISACLENNCTELKVSDITGVYNASTNLGGWETPNIAGSAVTSATLTINYPDNSTIQVVDVTSQIPSTVTGPFDFTVISPSSPETKFPDGKYKIVYSVTDGVTTYTYDLCVVFYCIINCAALNLFKQIPDNLDDEAFMDNAYLTQALLLGLESSACCQDVDSLEKIITKLEGLTNFEDCNCD